MIIVVILWAIPVITFFIIPPSFGAGIILTIIKLLFDFILLGLLNGHSKENKTETIKRYFSTYAIISAALSLMCYLGRNTYRYLGSLEVILSMTVLCVIAPFIIVFMASKKQMSVPELFKNLSEQSRKSSSFYIEDPELAALVKDIDAVHINPNPQLVTKWFTDTNFFRRFDKSISFDEKGDMLYNNWYSNYNPAGIINMFSRVVSYSVKDNRDAILNKLNDMRVSVAETSNAMTVNYNNYNKIKTGLQGELRVQNVINSTKEPNWILINSANLPIVNTEQTFENDAILITDRGVFAIEIKNYENATFEVSTDKTFYVVNGKTRTLWEDKSNRDNPIIQVEKHEKYLIALLNDAFKRDMSRYVFPIIVLSNDQCEIYNYSGFPIIYSNQIMDHIKGFPIAFSNPQPMNQIADCLKANLKKEKRFPFEFYDVDGYQPEVVDILNRCSAFLTKHNFTIPNP